MRCYLIHVALAMLLLHSSLGCLTCTAFIVLFPSFFLNALFFPPSSLDLCIPLHLLKQESLVGSTPFFNSTSIIFHLGV